ncbi:MAG: antibiotic biosynthesis monooxygenase [Bacteroidota bacterium]
MTKSINFCVIYTFKVRPGMEDSFMEGWSCLTEAIRETRGGLGSRLHKSDNGWWVAYAQWPDRQTWESSQTADESPDLEASNLMTEAIEDRVPPILLEPIIDLFDRSTDE